MISYLSSNHENINKLYKFTYLFMFPQTTELLFLYISLLFTYTCKINNIS
ncbi:hypothetical protein H312_02822 [Anncaliia algerae PRA339]|uniref:Uncharacterized protein n=1 Tax=Anncaliia algerae PRA339 TaxID=1288291 RepID=A0A059EXY7_9MICR|nr:hypothetical protein H312_02822 [Anncaliia algerae PRA339]